MDGQTIEFVEAFYQSHDSKLYNYNLYVNLSKIAREAYHKRLPVDRRGTSYYLVTAIFCRGRPLSPSDFRGKLWGTGTTRVVNLSPTEPLLQLLACSPPPPLLHIPILPTTPVRLSQSLDSIRLSQPQLQLPLS
ncbi:hypothetical protein M430DRAFT_180298 [Amorphotheca resinae ATCC 22711]|uniref:Uncharacterized protein n=1 Tax=Amorphotheca resinae ATCC 22711 TaxID=857342 RepID=A0A2T3ATS9_AMORE|nr:hypothetical protein M430DRAFT_180298 [Amorphotheca resinae ATCC 22711]PSS10886.1 hypothetical protein M430DRAFT_180298 [Amorphotheca resinae ATCC 22711]